MKHVTLLLLLSSLSGCSTVTYSNGDSEHYYQTLWRGVKNQAIYQDGTVINSAGLPTGERIYIAR